MPARRYVRSKRKPTYSVKKRTGKPMYKRKQLRLSAPLAGFPKSKLVRFRYAEEIALNPVTSGIAYHTFSANGLYDPNISGTGHQPFGFDQNMAFYDHYVVIGAICKARFTSSTGGNIVPAYFDILLTDADNTPTSFSSVSHFLESNFSSTMKMLQIGTERNYFGFNPFKTKTFSAKKFFRKNNVVDDVNLQGSASANPTEQAYFQIMTASIGGNDPGTLNILVSIEYTAILKEPALVAQS